MHSVYIVYLLMGNDDELLNSNFPFFNLIHDVQSNFIFPFSLIAFANQIIHVTLNLNSVLFLLRSMICNTQKSNNLDHVYSKFLKPLTSFD